MTRAAAKVALIGAGRIGQIHGRNAAVHPGLDLAWLVEPRAETGASLAAELGCRTATFAQALADPDLAAVIIASATDTHPGLAGAALAAGKAVVRPKPLGPGRRRP